VTPEEVAAPPSINDAAFFFCGACRLTWSACRRVNRKWRAFSGRHFSGISANGRSTELLADERWTDHWMGLLAGCTGGISEHHQGRRFNSTGPFRWFVRDEFRDGTAFDRFCHQFDDVARGAKVAGGERGFCNRRRERCAVLPPRAHIVGEGVSLEFNCKCARCHDSPYSQPRLQRDLYSLAAMF